MFDHIVSGTVINKFSYGPSRKPMTVPITKQNAILHEGAATMADAPANNGTWILQVGGVDKHGKPLVKNMYVGEMTWNCTNVGDKWPITSQA